MRPMRFVQILLACALLSGFTTPGHAADAPRVLLGRVLLVTTNDPGAVYREFYRLNQDRVPCYNRRCPQPANALQLNSSRVNDCWIQLAGQPPHSVRWELELNVLTTNLVLVPDPDGFIVQPAGRLPGLEITPGWHRVALDRDGTCLTLTIDDRAEATTRVAPDTRTPLRLTVSRAPLIWLRETAIFAPANAPWSRALAAPPADTNRVWQEVYHQTFEHADASQDFIAGPNSAVSCDPSNHCLRLAMPVQGPCHSAYAVLRPRFAGELRIRFRARSIVRDDHFFGLLTNCRRVSPSEDGYYCEWNRGWLRRIMKANVQRAMVRPSEPQDNALHWADYQYEQTGSLISMSKNNRVCLTWTDPDPITDPDFSNIAFYIFGTDMEFADLVIERNAAAISNELINAAAPSAKAPVALAADTLIVRQSTTATPAPSSGGLPALAPPTMTVLKMAEDTLTFQWQVQPGVVYDVERCNSLAAPATWLVVPGWSGVQSTGDTLTFTTPVTTTGHSFYRVVARPAP